MTRLFNLRNVNLALIIASCLGGPAEAQTAEPPISVRVVYSDVNLHNAAGARVMFDRIRGAARLACGGTPDIRLLDRVAVFDACNADTITRAIKVLNSPLVANLAGEANPVTRVATR